MRVESAVASPAWTEVATLPLIDVTYDSSVPGDSLRSLGEVLPAIVSEAVDCPEEPWIGPPAVGDIEIRFRAKSSFDVGELNCVIEVRTKLFPSRARDKQRRADLIRERLSSTIEIERFGIWLILFEGAWAQTDDEG
jgi:hypothetical protein